MAELVPIWLGRMNYPDAMVAQDAAAAATSRDHRVRLLGVEHSLAITLGRRAEHSQDVLSSTLIDNKAVPVFYSERGGQATLHDRGQLVIYPVADLRALGLGVREWVEALHLVANKTLRDFDVETVRNEQCTGLFTRNGKIGFIGVRVSRGISTHGVAINVTNDLDHFSLIRSCGVEGRTHDRISAWSNNPVLLDIYLSFMNHFLDSLHLTKRIDHGVSVGSFIGI